MLGFLFGMCFIADKEENYKLKFKGEKMNNKERIEEFKRIENLVNSYDFSQYPIIMEDSLGNKIKYPLDNEDVYLKIKVVLSISDLRIKDEDKK